MVGHPSARPVRTARRGTNSNGPSYVEVRSFAAELVDGEPALFLAGHFDTVSGRSQPGIARIARIDRATGAHDARFLPLGLEGSIRDTALGS